MVLATTIADTIVTGKVLTSLSTATAQTITATDTILEAFGYLQATITGLPSGLDYIGTWDARTVAEGGGSDGGTPDLRTAGLQVPGHYYIVATAGSATPNGAATTPDEWKIGDWVMRADATISEWQKIDNTSTIDGTGTSTKVALWTGTQTLGTGLIEDDGATVTIGTNGNLIVEGNTTLGNANTDTATVKGPAHFEETLRADVGISLGAATYGSAGDVLTSSGAAGTVNTWTTPTVGVVTSITGSTGITVAGTAAIPTVAITYAGASNAILAASAATPVAADTIWFNDADDSTIKKALISSLPFNNYSWDLNVDAGTPITIADTEEVDFKSGTGIVLSRSTRDVTTALRYADSDNAGTIENFVKSATTATPVSTDFLLFGDQAGALAIDTVKKATIADIVDLGNETLSEVLSNGNTTGATKISVNNSSSGVDLVDDTKIRFGDIAGTPDLEIYHTAGANSIIKATVTSPTAGPLLIQSDNLELQASSVSEKFLTTSVNAELNLFYNNVKKFETTATGISVTGGGVFTSAVTAPMYSIN